MPTEPPPVKQPFVDAVSADGYNFDHNCLVDAANNLVFPLVNSDTHAWSLGTNGYKLSDVTYLTLKGAIAQTDGSYIDTNNKRWWLEPNSPSSGWCQNVAWS